MVINVAEEHVTLIFMIKCGTALS